MSNKPDSRGSEGPNVDVIIVGSGAGALMAAVRAADLGLKPLVVEKAALIGGTSAISGGGIWIPCNDDQAQAGVRDTLEDAFRYVRTCAKGLASDDRILAYVETARLMARYLGSIGVPYRCMPLYADYYPSLPGARPGGRTMDPADFDAASLGLEGLAQMRPGNPGQALFGRINLNSFDAHTILSQGPGSVSVVLKNILRYATDLRWRLKTSKDRRMTGGQALVAGLLRAARQRQIPIWVDSPLQSLLTQEGRVAGAVIHHRGQDVRIVAKRGVVLAAGGFERNQDMRNQYLPKPTDARWTATPLDGNTGDAIRAGAAVGGTLHIMDLSWGVPTVNVPGEEKFRGVFVERSLPGCLVVNALGQRFVDESGPYPEFQQAMIANHQATGGAIPAWIVFDGRFRARYPMGPLLPTSLMPDRKVPQAWWDSVVWTAPTLEALATRIGVDPQGLRNSADRIAAFARTGKDEDFDRGGNVFDRYYGDVTVKPNPNLAPLSQAPFYAMQLWPGDIGTKGGLLTDRDARVLDAQGVVIPGLYCVGNNSASVMGPAYPGAGSTLGPAMTFAYRAASHLAGQPLPLERLDLLAG
ncbi:3-oxosteroid 1-dehydrogenase [Nitrospirillum amazonense]|uniref:3-oxosteroid 1-dehydrogenase n=1 Tax=Nitrospirillum amazonense TaxID=28077 RepID=A0A560J9U6_9PROT|nr:FAD-binding protein [Nitrospirillum amazonense]TWB66074.1 3-oxosteroid 1-dehydrogenase [Nitrospirillum amazonense]